MAVAKKKKVIRAPRAKKTTFDWSGWEDMSGEEFHRKRREATTHYYQDYKSADVIPFVYSWMKTNGYNNTQIAAAKAANGQTLITAGTYARCLSDGMPDFNEKHNEYWNSLAGTSGDIKPVSEFLHRVVKRAIDQGMSVVEEKEEEESKPSGPVKTIQQRMYETASKMCEPIEDHLHEMFSDPKKFDMKDIKIVNKLRELEAKAAHARVIKGIYSREKAEFEELLNYPTKAQLEKMSEHDRDMCEQLKEGYAHLDKTAIKKIIAFYTEIETACDMLAESQKATRKPRKPKEIKKDKVVAKLKYKKEDAPLKLVSVNPIDIVGAAELWVYNTKTRKLGKYVASNIDPTGQNRAGSGLSVKGTTIIGFDENASIQKTLRKPDEQLASFKNAGKVALRKFLDEIKAVDIKLNGRINDDVILLKLTK
jgi:hypothetical protein